MQGTATSRHCMLVTSNVQCTNSNDINTALSSGVMLVRKPIGQVEGGWRGGYATLMPAAAIILLL